MFFPVRLSLKPSRRLANLVFAIHGVTALSFLGSSLSPGLKIVGIVALAASLLQALRVVAQPRPRDLALDESGQLRHGAGAELGGPCPVLGRCRDLGWAVWLSWRDESGRRRHLMLLPDMLDDRENWRRLRIWLRHKAPKATGASRIRSADPG